DEVRAKDFSIGFDLALDETSGENQRWIEATRPNRSVRRTASVNRIQSVFPRLQAGFSRETSVVNPAAVRGQLEKVLLSAAFARAERMSRFLRFIVEETLQGRGCQLKEYLIGVEGFDRQESYDPRTDPVVRGEARRLRSKLMEYYEQEGRKDQIRIHLP